MAATGVPLSEVFAAATINKVEMFGLADRYGMPTRVASIRTP